MSAICQTASGFASRRVAPLAFELPRGLAESLRALGVVTMVRLRARQLLEALRGRHRKWFGGGGGPGEQPDSDAMPYSYCDDPALWMLIMMH
jgi:hypothetical protein